MARNRVCWSPLTALGVRQAGARARWQAPWKIRCLRARRRTELLLHVARVRVERHGLVGLLPPHVGALPHSHMQGVQRASCRLRSAALPHGWCTGGPLLYVVSLTAHARWCERCCRAQVVLQQRALPGKHYLSLKPVLMEVCQRTQQYLAHALLGPPGTHSRTKQCQGSATVVRPPMLTLAAVEAVPHRMLRALQAPIRIMAYSTRPRRLPSTPAEPPGGARACTRNSPLRNGRPRSHSGGRSGGAAPGVAGAAGGSPPPAKSNRSPTAGGGGTANASGAALPGRSTSLGTFQYAGPRLKGEFRSVCAPDAQVIRVCWTRK
jgi:hypothetical protein